VYLFGGCQQLRTAFWAISATQIWMSHHRCCHLSTLSSMLETMNTFDLVVSVEVPPDGLRHRPAASFGKTVAVIDSHHELGGAGANTGTVPSKTLRETALALSGMRSRRLYGVDLSYEESDGLDFLRHEENVKAGLNDVLSQRMASRTSRVHGTGVVRRLAYGSCSLHGRRQSSGFTLAGQNLLIATGSSPLDPATFSFTLRESTIRTRSSGSTVCLES